MRQKDQPGIGDDGGVRTDGFQESEVTLRRREIPVFRENIDGDVYLFAASVRIADRFGKRFVCKISGERAQAELLAADINRIRAEIKRRLEFGEISRRSQ